MQIWLLIIVLAGLAVIHLPALVMPAYYVNNALKKFIRPKLNELGYIITRSEPVSTFDKEHLPGGPPYSLYRYVYAKLELQNHQGETQQVTARITCLFHSIKSVDYDRPLEQIS